MKFRNKKTGEIKEFEPILLNAAKLSAQNRKRLFWTNIPNIPQPEDRGILLRDILEDNVDEGFYIKDEQLNRLKYLKGAKKIKRIKNGFEYNFSEGALKLTQDKKSLPLMASGGNSISRTTNFVEKMKSNSLRNGGKKANCLTSVQTDSMVVENYQIRKLTPIETERLTTLPDDFTKYGINEKGEEIEISNSQRYKMCGNAFLPEIIKHIIQSIPDSLFT